MRIRKKLIKKLKLLPIVEATRSITIKSYQHYKECKHQLFKEYCKERFLAQVELYKTQQELLRGAVLNTVLNSTALLKNAPLGQKKLNKETF